MRRRDGAHLGPLALVAVAAAAEHDGEPLRDVGTQRVERFRQRIGRVGVVDEDWRAAQRRAGEFEAAAARRGAWRDAATRPRRSPPVAIDETSSDECIGSLEVSDQRQVDDRLPAAMLDREPLTETVLLGGKEPQGLADPSDRDHIQPPRARQRLDLAAGLAVDIDRRRRRRAAAARRTGEASRAK